MLGAILAIIILIIIISVHTILYMRMLVAMWMSYRMNKRKREIGDAVLKQILSLSGNKKSDDDDNVGYA